MPSVQGGNGLREVVHARNYVKASRYRVKSRFVILNPNYKIKYAPIGKMTNWILSNIDQGLNLGRVTKLRLALIN